jgi:hypothetical protein
MNYFFRDNVNLNLVEMIRLCYWATKWYRIGQIINTSNKTNNNCRTKSDIVNNK